MKVIKTKKKVIILMFIFLFTGMSTCKTTSLQVANKEEGGGQETGEALNANTQIQEKEKAGTFEINGIRKRGIKRTNDKIMVENKAKDTPRAVISDDTRKQMLRDAKRAAKKQKYEDAIKITDAILEDRPSDKSALAVKENSEILLEEKKHKAVIAQLKKHHVYEKNRYSEDLREKAIMYNDMVNYPAREEWDGFKQRVVEEDFGKRLEKSREHTERLQIVPSPSQNILSQEMRDSLSMKLSVEFINTPIRDVVAFLQEKTKLNFIIGEDAADTTVDIKLNDVSVNTILKYILPRGIDLVIEDDVVHITLEPLELRVYDVRDLLINIGERKSSLSGGSGTTTGTAGGGGAGENTDSYDRVQEIVTMITTAIEPASWSANGGRGVIVAREGMLGDIVVTHVLNVHRQVEDILSALRSSADLQVNIEARFIAVSDNFLEEYGHDFTDFFRRDGTAGSEAVSEDTSIGTEMITNSVLGATGGMTVNWSILDNHFNITGILKAVQESDEAETVTSPNITLSNTQQGTIRVVTTNNYISSYTVVGDTPQPVISTIDDGTTFNVRPVVSADRKYVYLEVHPVITVVTFEEADYVTSGEATTDSGSSTVTTTSINKIQLPKTSVQELSVTVCVPDRGILLIGGLGKREETTASSGIPILSKIPIIKRLFSSDSSKQKKSNLIILIKPTILIREEEEARAFASRSEKAGYKYRIR